MIEHPPPPTPHSIERSFSKIWPHETRPEGWSAGTLGKMEGAENKDGRKEAWNYIGWGEGQRQQRKKETFDGTGGWDRMLTKRCFHPCHRTHWSVTRPAPSCQLWLFKQHLDKWSWLKVAAAGEGTGCWVDRGAARKQGAEQIRQKKNETLRVDIKSRTGWGTATPKSIGIAAHQWWTRNMSFYKKP